ncbi:hypothetical protein D3C87_1494880 [compost metagenome]
MTRPRTATGGSGDEHIPGGHLRKAGAVPVDDVLGVQIQHELRRQARRDIFPGDCRRAGAARRPAAELIMGIADDHGDVAALARCVGHERVPRQGMMVHHRVEIDPALLQRVRHLKRLDQPPGRQGRQLRRAIRCQPQMVEETPHPQFRVLRPHGGDMLTAHGDDTVIEAGRPRHGHQGHQLGPAA